MSRPNNSINLVVRSDGLKQNGFLPSMFDKLKDDPKIIARTARP